jgi:hypothetical protein
VKAPGVASSSEDLMRQHTAEDRFHAPMTSLICWVGADSRGAASAYIGTDSRISWSSTTTTARTWDLGLKTFASSNTPDVCGFLGAVLFPSIVLSQYVVALNAGLHPTASARFASLEKLVRVSHRAFPRGIEKGPFEITTLAERGTGSQPVLLSPRSPGMVDGSAGRHWRPRRRLPW